MFVNTTDFLGLSTAAMQVEGRTGFYVLFDECPCEQAVDCVPYIVAIDGVKHAARYVHDCDMWFNAVPGMVPYRIKGSVEQIYGRITGWYQAQQSGTEREVEIKPVQKESLAE